MLFERHPGLPAAALWLWSALAASAMGSAPRPAGPLAVDAFRYGSAGAAQAQWRATGEKTPGVEPSADGLVFPCPFRRADSDRFYWDRSVQLDLSSFDSLELDLSSSAPEAFRAVSVYIESGKGWYSWGGPLHKAGRQKIILSKKDFKAEGAPAGWGRVSRLRLSPWRGVPADASLVLHAITARCSPVLLIAGTASVTEAGERRIAAAAADRLRDWLAAMDVPVTLIDDREVSDATLARASVAILGYNPNPPDKELQALERFCARGGRLLVCYGNDARLARLLGFRLGEYQRAAEPMQWCSFSFADPGAWHVPARIFQESGNLRPAYPAAPDASVIAWWENERGQRTPYPAWVASPRGLWMSHILLNDDYQNKQHMLAALLAHYLPELWPTIVRPVMQDAGRIDSFAGADEAAAAIGRAAAGAPDEARVRGLLADAAAAQGAMAARQAQRDYGAVLEQGRAMRRALTEAYARVQPSAPGEFRGVWDHNGTGWYPGDWERTCRELAEGGFTAVFPNMAWAGLAHYESAVLPRSYTFSKHGDQVAQCAAAARRHGLQTHVWVCTWNVGGAPAAFVAKLKREGRLQATAEGATLPWLNPAHPDNVELMVSALREIARRYDVDGIQLDYIRYPASTACFSPYTRAAFEKSSGRRVARWPADVRAGGTRATEFARWRAAQITGFVARARKELRAVKPALKLSAAVYSSWPECRDTIAQDWGGWLEDGLVDFVCPMTYNESLAGFASATAGHLRLNGARGRLYPGIGVTANESHLLPDQVLDQIAAVRRLGAPGFMLFSLNPELREETIPILKLGALRNTAR